MRPRIDLDGVALSDPDNPHMVVAIFRYRTTAGLVLLVPESADVTVPWESVEAATLDLRGGRVEVRFAASFVARENWLRGARVLSGIWTDRLQLASAP
jgi:hypothetical protein